MFTKEILVFIYGSLLPVCAQIKIDNSVDLLFSPYMQFTLNDVFS